MAWHPQPARVRWYQLGSWLLALVFGGAALDKTFRFWEFLQVVSAYRIVPPRYAVPVAVLVIVAELVCALFLVYPATRLKGAILSGVLAAIFLEAGLFARAYGYEGDCGCLSILSQPAGGWLHVLENLVLIGLATALVSKDVKVREKFLRFVCGRKGIVILLAVLAVDGALVVWAWTARTGNRVGVIGGTADAPSRGQSALTAADAKEYKLLADTILSVNSDPRLVFGMPKAIRLAGENHLVVLDTYRARVVVLDTTGQFLRAFGKKGKGPGELGIPSAMCVGPQRKIYAADPGNRRVCIFSSEGRFLRSFPCDGVGESIAVDSKGRIYSNEPGRGKLMAVYDSTGKLQETFGELLPYEPPAPPIPGAANAVVFDLDSEDNLWLAFEVHPKPEIRKYNARHQIVFSRRIRWPEVTEELETYNKRGKGYLYPIFAKDLFVDETDRVWVLLHLRSTIYCVNRDGRVLLRLVPIDPRLSNLRFLLGGVAARARSVWATDKYHREVVKFVLPGEVPRP